MPYLDIDYSSLARQPDYPTLLRYNYFITFDCHEQEGPKAFLRLFAHIHARNSAGPAVANLVALCYLDHDRFFDFVAFVLVKLSPVANSLAETQPDSESRKVVVACLSHLNIALTSSYCGQKLPIHECEQLAAIIVEIAGQVGEFYKRQKALETQIVLEWLIEKAVPIFRLFDEYPITTH